MGIIGEAGQGKYGELYGGYPYFPCIASPIPSSYMGSYMGSYRVAIWG